MMGMKGGVRCNGESREKMTTTWNGITHLENSNVTSFGPNQRVVIAAARTKTPHQKDAAKESKRRDTVRVLKYVEQRSWFTW